MASEYRQQFEIEYWEEITEKRPPSEGRGSYGVAVGRRLMKATVVVVVDLDAAATKMGRRAARSVSGRCRDGVTTVRRIGQPAEVRREARL